MGTDRARTVLLTVLVVLAVAGGSMVVDVLRTPGDDGLVAKLAEWSRDHGLGGLVTWLEKRAYAA